MRPWTSRQWYSAVAGGRKISRHEGITKRIGQPSRNSRSVRDVLLLPRAWRMRPGQERAGRPASALGADRTQDDGDGSSRSNSRLGFQRINSHGLRPDWPDFLLAAGEARGLLVIPALADEMATSPPACPAGTGAMSKREGIHASTWRPQGTQRARTRTWQAIAVTAAAGD